MDFLLERAKTIKRSAPPHRKGETTDPMDLWASVYKNQMHIAKTIPHAPRNVQLGLAEKYTFEEYCKFQPLTFIPFMPKSKSGDVGAIANRARLTSSLGGTEEMDAFKNFDVNARSGAKQKTGNTAPASRAANVDEKISAKQQTGNTAPAAPAAPALRAARVRDLAPPASNERMHAVQAPSPADITTSFPKHGKSLGEDIGSTAASGGQPPMSTTLHHGIMAPSGPRLT